MVKITSFIGLQGALLKAAFLVGFMGSLLGA